MLNLLIVLFTAGLILLCGFLTLVILMQKSSGNAGMGSALGGGAAESAFGGQTSSVLSKATIYGIAGFFVLVFSLYLTHMAVAKESAGELDILAPDALTSKEGDMPAVDAVSLEDLEQSAEQLADEADALVEEADKTLEATTEEVTQETDSVAQEVTQEVEAAAEEVAETMTTVEEKVEEEVQSAEENAPQSEAPAAEQTTEESAAEQPEQKTNGN